ncbi:hypothetical protein ACFC06_16305 [Nocardia sp. NPDC056064]|uniref:hypothetical protein n=1 Tax=Nocardia sp. NPDC056064 TaxID=3345701 RepID=UPI0035D8D919
MKPEDGIFPHGDRVVRGGCTWHHTPDSDAGLASLRSADPFAFGNLRGQIEESEKRGLGSSTYREPVDYRCPLEFAPKDEPDAPWLGELKAGGKKGVQWRLYFGEPINHAALVVGVSLRDSKWSRLTAAQNSSRQRQHIKQAMRFLKSYFRSQGYLWAAFPGRSE